MKRVLLILVIVLGMLRSVSAQVTFNTLTTGINSEPYFATFADFNGDGKLDMANCTNNNPNLWISLGNGDGTFGPPASFPVGQNPRGVGAADFDGDGKIDVAVANLNGTTVSLMKGNGDGTFTSVGEISNIPNPFIVTTSDFNKDGNTDLAVSLANSGQINIYLGDGHGNFTISDSIIVGNTSCLPNSISVADIDGDGELDIAEVNSSSNDGYILKGAGDGTFTTSTYLSGFSQPWQITVADLNCDGKPDLVVNNRNGNNISVLLNTGGGNFGAATTFPTDDSPLYQTTGDFNGDGKVDIAVCNYGSGTMDLFLGNGAGGFSTVGTNTPYTTGGGPWSIYTEDFNMDGKPDLMTVNTFTGDVSVFLLTSPLAGGTVGVLDIEPKSPSVCQGQIVALTVNGGSGQGTNFKWSPSAALNKPTGDTVLATVTTMVVYTVTGGGACPSVGTDTVKILTAPPVTFTPASPHGCPGQLVSIVASGGTNLSWSPGGAIRNIYNNGDSVTAFLLPGDTTEVFEVTGTSTVGSGCPDTGFVTLHSGGLADGGIVTAVRDTICLNTPGNLSLVGNSGNNIQWQSSPDDITYTNISAATNSTYKTTPLQQSTWYHAVVGTGNCSATSDSLQLYVPPALTAYFNFTEAGANSLKFNSDSSIGNIRNYHWDFGDGNTSDSANPSHTFAKDSTYYVCLTLYDGSNCSYTFCRYSPVTDGVPTISAAGNWVIYPNPFSGQLTVSSKQSTVSSHIQSIEMYDVLGQLVINQNVGNSTNTSLQLDVSSLAKGMYYVMIRTADADYVQKVVKQ